MRTLLVVLILFLAASGADAQRHNRGIAERGDLALSVGFSGLSNFSLNPLEGGIGVRYRAADRTVLGASVAIGGADESSEQSSLRSVRDDLDILETNVSDFGRQSASLTLWTEHHLGRRRSTVSPFVGVSLRIGTGSSDALDTRTQRCIGAGAAGCPLQVQEIDREMESVSYGGGLLLGGEVKIVNGLTVSGAYTYGVMYQDMQRVDETIFFQDGTEVQTLTSESVQDGWTYGVGTTQVALSLYF